MMELKKATPGQGAIVIYHHHAGGRWGPGSSPAIVHAANKDGSLRLWVFGLWGIDLNPHVEAGGGEGQWSWPAGEVEILEGADFVPGLKFIEAKRKAGGE